MKRLRDEATLKKNNSSHLPKRGPRMNAFLRYLMVFILIFDPVFSLDYAHSALENNTPVLSQQNTKDSAKIDKMAVPFKLGGDCGPKVLQKILLILGKTISLEQLIEETDTIKGQTNFAGLLQGAKKEGLWALGVKTDISTVQKLLNKGYFFIAHVGGNKHYVLIQDISKKWVIGYNPAVHSQEWKLPYSTFKSVWKNEGLIVWKPSQLDFQLITLGMALPLGFESQMKLLPSARLKSIWGGTICQNCNEDGGPRKGGATTGKLVELSNGDVMMSVTDINIPAVGPDLLLERTYHTQLFSDIEGWQPEGGTGSWSIKDGAYAGSGDRSTTEDEWEDVEVELEVKTTEPGETYNYETAWINVRYQNDDNRYFFLIKTNGDIELTRRKAGVPTVLGYQASAGYDPTEWNTVKMRANGSNIKVWVNSNLEFDITDTNPVTGSGHVVLESYYSHASYDDIEITDLTTTTSQNWDFSNDDNKGMFGRGWRSNIEVNLIILDNDDVIVRRENDRRDLFTWDVATSSWISSSGIYNSLTHGASGYEVRDKEGTIYLFNDSGRLISMSDRYDNTLTLSYTTVAGKERVETMTEEKGRTLTFSYDESTGRCEQITDPLSRTINYTYNADGLLETAEDARGYDRVYDYDDHYRLIKYTDRNGNEFQYEYSYNDRVIVQIDPNLNETHFNYLWDVTQITDAAENVWTHQFDSNGALISEIDPEGNETTYDWDENYNLESITDPEGRIVQYTYDAQGNRISVTDPLDQDTTATYESTYNQPTASTDNLNYTTTTSYNANGSPILITDPQGNTIEMDYDEQGLLTTMTDKRGNVTVYTYDENGYPDIVTDSLENIVDYDYDDGGRLLQVEDALGHIIQYDYDENNNVIEITDAENNVTTFEYDGNGNKTQYTDAFGKATVYEYNEYDIVETVTDPNLRVTTYTYDPSRFMVTKEASLSEVENPAHHVTQYFRDKIGRLIELKDARDFSTTYTHDNAGNVIKITDANSNDTEYEYDALDRVITTTYADSTYEKNEYDANGNIREEILRDNKSITYFYNERNELIQRIVNSYDGIYLNNTTWDVGGTTAWQGDNFDLKVSMQTIDPGIEDWHTSRINFRYQDADNLYYFLIKQAGGMELVRRKAASQTWLVSSGTSYDPTKLLFIRIQMNGANIKVWVNNHLEINITDGNPVTGNGKIRLEGHSSNDYFDNVQIKDLDTSGIEAYYSTIFDEYTYDENGNNIQITRNGTQNWTFEYDELNRLIGTEDSEGRQIQYIRDEKGQIEEMTYPSGLDLTYTYDGNGRMLSVTGTAATYVTYTYDDRGQRSSRTLGNGLDTTYTYDDAGQLENLLTTSGSITIASYSYSYDDLGNRETQTDLTGTTTMVYDEISQVTNVTYPNSSTQEYVYDPVHNREVFDTGTSTEYTVNEMNEVTLSETGSNSVTYNWDNRGNLEEKIDVSTTTTYTHNLLNQLAGVEKTGEDAVSFEYDPLGRRITKTVGATTYHYTWAEDKLMEVRDNGGALLQTFIYGASTDEPVALINYIGPFYYTQDGLGSVTEITNYAGTLLEKYTYDVYGAPSLFDDTASQINSSFIDNPLYFTGREYDAETGLYYYRARYYDPNLGRFLETDPQGYGDSMNLFAYVVNNPWNATDPSGMWTEYPGDFKGAGFDSTIRNETARSSAINFLREVKRLKSNANKSVKGQSSVKATSGATRDLATPNAVAVVNFIGNSGISIPGGIVGTSKVAVDSPGGARPVNQGRWVIGPDGGWMWRWDKREETPEENKERCKEQLEICIDQCLEWVDFGDYGQKYRQCIHNCMDAEDCSYAPGFPGQ